jgi:hypothetical protein
MPVVMFEAFRDERAAPDAIKLPDTVSWSVFTYGIVSVS